MAIENVKKSGARKLVCTHFNPAHNDAALDDIQKYYTNGWPHEANNNNFPIVLAQEGMEIEI